MATRKKIQWIARCVVVLWMIIGAVIFVKEPTVTIRLIDAWALIVLWFCITALMLIAVELFTEPRQ